MVSLDLIGRKWHSAEAVKDWHDILGGQVVLGEAKELKRAVLFKDADELLEHRATELVVGEIEDLEVTVHVKVGLRLQGKSDVLQILITETRSPHEHNLELLTLSDDLRKWADFAKRILLCRFTQLVELVLTSRD